MSKRSKNRHDCGVDKHVAHTLLSLTRYVAISQQMAVAYGRPRIGKSFAVKSLEGVVELGGPIVLRVQRTSHTKWTILRGLCSRFGLPSSGTMYDLGERVRAHISETRPTIILDDCDRMTPHALEVVRGLWDATECPVLFVGNGDVTRVRGASEQFVTRVFISRCIEPLEGGDAWLSSARSVHKLLDVPRLRFVEDLVD